MARREKKPVHKVVMTEGKRNIIQQILQEYDIETAEDIQDALKDLLDGTIKEMMEAEMDDHLGYQKSERSDSDDYRNGYKSRRVNSSYGNMDIDVPQDHKAQESKGYEQWAKIHNLKQAAKTLNFLTEHKIEQYADLTAKISEIAAANEQTADSLKAAEKRLADMAVLIKNVTTYQKTKPAYDAYRKAKNKDRYRTEHERAIILHEAAAKALQTAGIKKLPNLTSLQAEYEQLQEQKEALYADYGKLKKQVKEYDVIKRNIDSILRKEKELEEELIKVER